MKTPVTLIIFKRLHSTKKVLEAIRQAKPPKLLVIGDGPRPDRPDEAEKCIATRAIIECGVDWNCEVLTNYSDVNLGCKRRISSGLDWVFNTVEEAIILEDDCLPQPTFFRFCEELLDYYRHDKRVMSIGGQNIQFGRKRTEYSYYFSRYNCWGWATWRRAWQYYDVKMELWPKVREGGLLKDILIDSRATKYWTNYFQGTYDGNIDTWDYQWTFNSWIQRGLTILPEVNLISNIGFEPEATNTTNQGSQYDSMPTKAITFPLKHPPFTIRNLEADKFTQNTFFDPSLLTRARAKFNRTLGFKYI